MIKSPAHQISLFDSNLPHLFVGLGLESFLLSGLIAIGYLQSHSLNTSNRSMSWLIAICLTLLFGITFLFQAAALKKRNQQSKWLAPLRCLAKSPVLGLCITLFSFIIIMFSLSELSDPGDQLFNKLMVWIGLLFYTWLLSLLIYYVIHKQQAFRSKANQSLAITLLVFAILWILLSVTRVGLQPDSRYWNTAGVPVLAIALAGILLAIIVIDQGMRWLIRNNSWQPSIGTRVLLEVVLVLGIWLIASLLWIKTPFSNSFFFYGPLPPDGALLPSSDARLMDLGGQYLIIGGKLETPYFTEKPFYALFLGLIHYFFGQSYLVTTNVQILILALFPVCLYLLGKQFAGRLFGLALATFGIFKEFTALLFTYKISVSNSRLYMTEFPSALLLIIAGLMLVQWLGYQKSSKTLPLAAGGILGIASFVRSNNVVVFGFFLLFLFLINLRNLRKQLPYLALFTLGALFVILPWSVYTRVNYGKDPITWKVQQALFQRYEPDSPQPIEPITQTSDTKIVLASHPITSQGESLTNKTSVPVPTATNPRPNGLVPMSADESPQADSDIVQIPQETPALYSNRLVLVLGHFFNNQVKALFVLPFQIFPQKPTLVLNQEYWREPITWTGQLPPEQALAFASNLIFISLGLSYAWKKLGWAGFVPLLLNISYYLSNALVRTSGSRYLLPVDWTIYFYYLLGIWSILLYFNLITSNITPVHTSSVHAGMKIHSFWALILTGTLLLIIGLSLPLLNLAFPTLYHDENKQAVFERLPLQKIKDEIGISPEGMREFSEKPYAVLIYGKAIYSGYFRIKEDPVIAGNTFTILTPTQYDVLIGDGTEPQAPLPAGEDMIVVGCQHSGEPYIDAYLGYFVQSDKLIWATNTTFRDICP